MIEDPVQWLGLQLNLDKDGLRATISYVNNRGLLFFITRSPGTIAGVSQARTPYVGNHCRPDQTNGGLRLDSPWQVHDGMRVKWLFASLESPPSKFAFVKKWGVERNQMSTPMPPLAS